MVVFVPTFVGETSNDISEDTYILEEGDFVNLGQHLELEVVTVDGNSADVMVTDLQNGERETATINEFESHTFVMPDGNIEVENNNIHNGEVTLLTEYPHNYGWSDSEKQAGGFMIHVILWPMLIIIVGILYSIIFSKESN